VIASRALDLSDVRAVDGHSHPLLPEPWAISAERFADFFTEGRPGRMTPHVQYTGYFQRTLSDLARRLGTDATVNAVLDARRRVGVGGTRHAFEASRIAAILVDTGYPPEAMSLEQMRTLLPCAIHEIFRIETCAQDLLVRRLSFDEFLATFRGALESATKEIAAFKSVIAYRTGLAIGSWTSREAEMAYRSAVGRVSAGGSARLTEKPLLDTLLTVALEVCRDTGRPLQLHAGFGDPDLDLLQANPLLLRPLLEDARWADVRLVVLHMAYPYFREAAFMAAVWPQIHVDLSLALPFLGPGAVSPLVEILSLAPASKLLYGSDVGGLPELFTLSADWARASLGEALAWLSERGGFGQDDGRRIAAQIFADNAMSLYRLPA
jgi:predicted TIM-barrel fold metal-dependent hydrolase